MIHLAKLLAWIGMVALLITGFFGEEPLGISWALLFMANGHIIQKGENAWGLE
jgi:hypothetical protein